MYEPEAFRVTDRVTLLEVMRVRPLGLVVSLGAEGAEGVWADAIPFMAQESVAEQGGTGLQLLAHVARANPIWRRLRENPAVLVVFQAEDAYISPSWYASKVETHKVVPTWNYVMVQARGRAMVHDDADWVRRQVANLTQGHEAERPVPWAMTDAPPAYIDAQLRGIVGIEIAVDDLRGKFKLSQNRSAEDRAGVIAGLGDSARGRAMATRMQGSPDAAEGSHHG